MSSDQSAVGLGLQEGEAPALATPVPSRTRLRRILRRLGAILVVLGVLGILYGAAVYFWHDPVTDLYARWKQHGLAQELDKSFAEFRATSAGSRVSTPSSAEAGSVDPAARAARVRSQEAATRRAAQRYFAQLELGQPVGRIDIPKLGIDPVFVNGTRWGADLSRGPGRYPETSLPGLGKVTAIAGHRTTFGAPFRHIDRLEAGDPITLELAYGTFHYRVVGHEIVDNDDWSIIDPRGYDELVLSACHPLYSASHRYVVFARLASVEGPDGQGYVVPKSAS
jgi:sortase A